VDGEPSHNRPFVFHNPSAPAHSDGIVAEPVCEMTCCRISRSTGCEHRRVVYAYAGWRWARTNAFTASGCSSWRK